MSKQFWSRLKEGYKTASEFFAAVRGCIRDLYACLKRREGQRKEDSWIILEHNVIVTAPRTDSEGTEHFLISALSADSGGSAGSCVCRHVEVTHSTPFPFLLSFSFSPSPFFSTLESPGNRVICLAHWKTVSYSIVLIRVKENIWSPSQRVWLTSCKVRCPTAAETPLVSAFRHVLVWRNKHKQNM